MRIAAAHVDTRDAGLDQRVGAGPRPTLEAARLQGDGDRSTAQPASGPAGGGEGRDLRVRSRGWLRPAAAQGATAPEHDGPDARVGKGPSKAGSSAAESPPHRLFRGHESSAEGASIDSKKSA